MWIAERAVGEQLAAQGGKVRFKRLEAANKWYKFKSSHFPIPNATLAVQWNDETAKLPVPARQWPVGSAVISPVAMKP